MDPMTQLELAIEAVFKSWMGRRAVDYRGNSRSLQTSPMEQRSMSAPWFSETWEPIRRQGWRLHEIQEAEKIFSMVNI